MNITTHFSPVYLHEKNISKYMIKTGVTNSKGKNHSPNAQCTSEKAYNLKTDTFSKILI